MERKVLGRGLEALIPQAAQDSREKVQMLKVSQIIPSRFQPRSNFSPERIEELAKSIAEKGMIQPIIARATSVDGQYELIAGERRLRAVKHLGQEEIPVIIRRVADADVLEMAIIENIQREELNALEIAKGYKRLMQEFGLNQDSIAKRVGKDKTSVSNLLRILNLPTMIQDYLSREMITFGHAKAILSITDEKRQIRLCESIVKKGLSVRQAEQAGTHRRSIRPAGSRDHHLKELEEKLQHSLGTRVRIRHGKKRGRIEIEYYSLDDLDRLLKLLTI